MKNDGKKPTIGDLVRFYLGHNPRVELIGLVESIKFDSHLPDSYEVTVLYESSYTDFGYSRLGRKLGMFLSELSEIIETEERCQRTN